MTAAAATSQPTLGRRIAGQGAMLLAGGVLGQCLAFARNALLAYGLSKGNFGIAVAVLIALQLIESMMELPAERFIVQADEGDDPDVLANSHTILILRGLAASAVLYFASGSIAAFFGIAETAPAFAAMAMVPLVKGYQHLDQRRRQRRLDNSASLAIELIPQAVALVLTLPLLQISGGYEAVVWLAVGQAITQVAISHLVANEPYRLGFERPLLGRMARFGWPVLASAWPHAATYYGERAIIGRWLGMEALAGYSLAFLLTSAAGIITARIGQALVLPLLASAKDDATTFTRRFVGMLELHIIAAAVLATATIAGGNGVMRLFFGKQYWAYGVVLGWLSVLWAIRIAQSMPSLALMAKGNTGAFFWATLLRATAVLPVLWAAMQGARLETLVAIAIAGELASLAAYLVALRNQRALVVACITRMSWLVVAITIAALTPTMPNSMGGLALATTLGILTAMAGALVMPETRALVLRHGVSWRAWTQPAHQKP
jgi:O-antigen/teichoic acid export membrane protein